MGFCAEAALAEQVVAEKEVARHDDRLSARRRPPRVEMRNVMLGADLR